MLVNQATAKGKIAGTNEKKLAVLIVEDETFGRTVIMGLICKARGVLLNF